MTTGSLTIASARKDLDEFVKILEQIAPNPASNRLLAIDHEYSMVEIRDLLQHFGSYLASLIGIQGRIEAEQTIISKALKIGISIAILKPEIQSTTISGKEAELLSQDDGFAETKRLEIKNEARLTLVKSWVKAYEAAYTAASRIFSVDSTEANLPRMS
jgi:hypothetical protein